MLPFSKSTSQLEVGSASATIPGAQRPCKLPLLAESPPRRHVSTEGLFSIIDTRFKTHSSSSDSEDETMSRTVFPASSTRIVPGSAQSPKTATSAPKPRKVDFVVPLPSSPSTPTMSSAGGSRFRIVPVESRYKRGRWTCHDFYDKEPVRPTATSTAKMSCPPPLRPVAQPTSELQKSNHPRTAPIAQNQFHFGANERENVRTFSQTTPAFSRNGANHAAERKQAIATPINNTQRDKDGKYTPSELLQNGLEHTLSGELQPKRIVASSATASTPPMVAIDSKIEQAMDLVKTHLMFAVREEVEVLRARIVDLETHVHNLEAENSVLRGHVPDEIIKKFSLH